MWQVQSLYRSRFEPYRLTPSGGGLSMPGSMHASAVQAWHQDQALTMRPDDVNTNCNASWGSYLAPLRVASTAGEQLCTRTGRLPHAEVSFATHTEAQFSCRCRPVTPTLDVDFELPHQSEVAYRPPLIAASRSPPPAGGMAKSQCQMRFLDTSPLTWH